MIDLETLAVTPRAAVLTLGAVHFDPLSTGYRDTFYIRIELEDQEKLGRDIDQSTLDWWAKQDPVIMEEAFSPHDRYPLEEAIHRFHKFAWGCSNFWSHGSAFDLVILEDIYRQLKRTPPWSFWQLRDTRTIFDLGIDPEMPKDSKHNALQDAIRQTIGVQNVYNKLNIKLTR
jgi:hypothetical protein